MGQYYKPIILGEAPKNNEKEIIKSWLYSHEYDNGLKLMEHSYIGNDFVSAFESLLINKSERVVWAGDYADNEPNLEGNLYHFCDDDIKIKPDVIDVSEYIFIVNHTKKMFVNKNNVPKIPKWGVKIHPLPLLTCEGNGNGGGDFYGNDKKNIVGSWARDLISIEKDLPIEYIELKFNLKK